MSDLKIQGVVQMDTSGTDAAFARVESNAKKMATGLKSSVDEAGKSVEGLGEKSSKASEKLTRDYGRMAESIKRSTFEINNLGKSLSEKFEAKIAYKGLDATKFQADIAMLRQAEAMANGTLGKVEMSARATAAALRGVPAQFTDIVTSLQSGQAPLTVFLQQGGQLKDMFGGAGNAARALGGYVLGLVNPFTLLAAAVAATTIAYYKGSQEAQEYAKSLILTGNAIGLTNNQLQGYARNISLVAGTQAKAAEALTQFVTFGRVGRESLEGFALAAVRFEAATGTTISKTVEKFAELAKSPSEASAKLNEQMNYLTASVYDQIKALEQQGKTTEAANLAQKTFADTIESRASQVVQNLGSIERGWISIKNAIKSAADAWANVGRDKTPQERIAELQERIRAREQNPGFYVQNSDGAAFGSGRINRRNADALNQAEGAAVAALAGAVYQTEEYAKARAEANEQNTKAVAAINAVTAANEKSKSKQDQLNDALKTYRAQLEDIRTKEPNSKLLDPKTIARTEQFIRDSFAEKAKKPKNLVDPYDIESMKAYAKAIDDFGRIAQNAAGKADGLSKTQEELRAIQDSPIWATFNRQQQEQVILAASVSQAEEDRAAAMKRSATIAQETQKALEASADAQRQLVAASVNTAVQAEQELANYGLLKSQIYSLQLAKLEEARESARLAGEDVATIETRIEAMKRLIAAQKGIEVKDDAKKRADEYKREWERTADFIEQSLTDALLRGFESGKSFAKNFRDTLVNMFKTLVLKPIISAVLAPVSGAITGFVGSTLGLTAGTAAAASGGSSALGALGAAGSVANLAGGLGGGIMNGLSAWGAGGSVSGVLSNPGLYSGAELFGAGLPILAGVGALFALAKATKGETRAGGQYGFGIDGIGTSNRRGTNFSGMNGAFFLEGPSGGDPYQAQAIKGINDTVAAINARFKSIGSGASVSNFNAGYESSGKDRGGVFSGGALSNGRFFGESGQGDNYAGTLFESTSTRSPDTATAIANFATDLLQVSIQALQADDGLPQVLKDILKGIDAESLSSEAATALLTEVDRTIAGVESLTSAFDQLPFEALKDLSFDAAAGMVELAGGIDTLRSNLATYYQNFFTVEEQRQQTAQNIASGLNKAGGSFNAEQILGMTRDQFRALVTSYEEQAAAGSEAAQKMLVSLYAVAGAFASLTPSAEQAAEALEQTTAALKAQQQQAQDGAFSTLQRIISRERAVAEAARSAAQEQVGSLGSLFDLLKESVSELRSEISSSASASAARGNRFIDNALSTARASGYLPDSEALQEAIGQARNGLNRRFSSTAEKEFQSLVLAGKLEELQKLTGGQLSTAEKSLLAAEQQVDALDATLEYWKQQIDISRDIDSGITSLEAAISNLAGLLGVKNAGPSTGKPAGGGAVFGGGGAAPSGSAAKYNAVKYLGTSGTGLDPVLDPDVIAKLDKLSPLYHSFDGSGNLVGLLTAIKEAGGTMRDLSILSGFYESDWVKAAAAVGIPAFASGGNHSGGWALLGERGPELVNLQPSRIYSNGDSMNMMGGWSQVVGAVDRLNQRMARIEVISGDNLNETRRITRQPLRTKVIA